MSPQSEVAMATVVVITWLLGLAGLLCLGGCIQRRRAVRFARQVALTDAIHLELGAVVAPEVRRAGLGGWEVSMRVPFEREAAVGAVVRIANQLFSRLDRADAPGLRIVLRPQTPCPAPQGLLPRARGQARERVARAGAGSFDALSRPWS
jgi:hypothetical protein